MSIFKCKMCGGTIEFEPGATVGVCDSCGTKQTLPRLDDDRRANLYDRANHFRRANEFDKAAGLYEQILNEDPSDAEAYWSLVLCRYGIEYVEDPATHRRVPTVNRTQFTSIFDDEDYHSALKYADGFQRQIYEEEAAAINEIQKGILSISQKEKPFDVFICYKDTDANGRRTVDSVLANDLYHQLTQEGFKVFFSRITLEDKLGSAYEPYIFAALNSAKVMVVLGTKPEHFNAVWVKNEWSRYLKLIKTGAKKTLIPAYRDMDPYDLPEEFSHLMAQDMSKLGFMQDLIRGIKKIAGADDTKSARETVVVSSGSANTAPLLRRAFMFLEDGEWENADEYCEKVLDLDPENAQAYLGKLMAELCVHRQEDLPDCERPFDRSSNYQKAVRFGDKKLVAELEGYAEQCLDKAKEKIDAVAAAVREKNTEGRSVSLAEQLAREKAQLSKVQPLVQVFDSIAGEIQKAKFEVQRNEEEIKELRTMRASLGLFAGKEKKQIDTKIEGLEANKTTAEKVIKSKTEELKGFSTRQEVEASIQQINIKISGLEAKIQEAANSGNKKLTYEQAVKIYYSDEDVRTRFNAKYPELVDSIKTIKLGSYYQSSGNSREPIEWLILGQQGSKLLLISKYALDCQKYNTSRTDVTWETCSLRKWLNGTFINAAFSSEEKAMIPTVTVSADKNPSYDTSPGNNTKDQVFLLSIPEVEKYFSSDEARKCVLTEYAIAQDAWTDDEYQVDGKPTCWWWLRSPGNYSDRAANVDFVGSVYYYGDFVSGGDSAVRPALWIDLGS